MCGIIGYVGGREVVPVLIDGLRRLEYRGYDSAGIAVAEGKELRIWRSSGKIANLDVHVNGKGGGSTCGLGHTRWATHGRPSEENAHPHRDCSGTIVVVHNGIVENYVALKHALAAQGHTFRTETDTEVIAHTIEKYYRGDLAAACRLAVAELEGVYCFAALSSAGDGGAIVAARNGPPLVLGVGNGENFVSSDVAAILPYTKQVIFLDDGEMAVVRRSELSITTIGGEAVNREPQTLRWDPVMVEKGGYKHFMLKEIHEQPMAIRETCYGRVSLDTGEVFLRDTGLDASVMKDIRGVALVACGTSWHAALVGKFYLEQIARIPCEVDYASEYRYRAPLTGPHILTVVITQSGETADTLAALREARERGSRVIAICNVEGSVAVRESSGALLTHAGPEIGVASTKAFTSQLAALYLLAHFLGQQKGTIAPAESLAGLTELARIPHKVETVLQRSRVVEELARKFFRSSDFLYIARGINYPVALEGALKLKEISYIHAEGYPAGEMKHGPIALIDEEMPVVVIGTNRMLASKTASNMQEVKTRGGILITVTTDDATDAVSDHVVRLPPTGDLLSPILAVVPLQLLAYHIALLRGCDVDQPRNLAKSVTVE
ncbi:MAG: glutamine--fructose-6-phosphate transaminase (isomerizing) [Acidobacteria bacterium]|nr:glutamine--fructose-6-phosphate transaminase (isomerizing) [Acidobacteriota bacterium]